MRTCLVVDDSLVVRKVARRILEGLCFAVEEARDGKAALAACGRRMPEAVLLDRNMPVMNGIDFLLALRRMADGAGPVVILCTTASGVDDIAEALGAGANDYVVKPFDGQILQAKFLEAGLL